MAGKQRIGTRPCGYKLQVHVDKPVDQSDHTAREVLTALQAVKRLISRGLNYLAGRATIVQDFTDVN